MPRSAFSKSTRKTRMADESENWQVYIIEADDAALYTGITTDLERRFDEHLQKRSGARYFNGRKPLRVVYSESGHTRSSASRREAEIKKLPRAEKQNLVLARQAESGDA